MVQTVHQSCKERIARTGGILTGEFRNIAQQTRPAVLENETAVLIQLDQRVLKILSQYAERLLRRVPAGDLECFLGIRRVVIRQTQIIAVFLKAQFIIPIRMVPSSCSLRYTGKKPSCICTSLAPLDMVYTRSSSSSVMAVGLQ